MRRAVTALAFVLVCGGMPATGQNQVQPEQPAAGSPAPAAKPSEDTRLDGLKKPEDTGPKAAESWWQRLVRETPNCRSYTDGCRICSAAYICSNIGIACQPKEWACNDAKPEVKPDASPDHKPEPKQQ